MSDDKRVDVPHYTAGGIEVIDILRAKMTPEMVRGFCMGNVIKYVLRHMYKGTPAADLEKAATYLGWLRESVAEKTGAVFSDDWTRCEVKHDPEIEAAIKRSQEMAGQSGIRWSDSDGSPHPHDKIVSVVF